MNKPVILSFPNSGSHLLWGMMYKNYTGGGGYIKDKQERGVFYLNDPQMHVLILHNLPSELEDSFKTKIFNHSPIHLIRDPKDAISSHIIKMRSHISNPSIDNFTQGLAIEWKKHTEQWGAYKDIIKVRYENILKHYDIERRRIEDYTGLKIKQCLPKINEISTGRKGEIGDHKNYLSNKQISIIEEICEEEINRVDTLLY